VRILIASLATVLAAAASAFPTDLLGAALAPGRTTMTVDELRQATASGQSLVGQDFSDSAFAGQDFTSLDLRASIWRKADLRGARFTSCDLRQADFSEALLNGASFESCQLAEAAFVNASLPGVQFSASDLAGASFDGATITGAELEGVVVSPTGAPHLPALRAALTLRGMEAPSLALVAAASGDAFAFTYQRTDRGAWPGYPMTYNPITLALDTLGYHVTEHVKLSSDGDARAELVATLRKGSVALLPMRLAGGGLTGDTVEEPTWAAVYEVAAADAAYTTVTAYTPFGPMEFGTDDLVRRWKGPWHYMTPAGQGRFTTTYPMYAVGARKAEVAPTDAAIDAMTHATVIAREARSFGDMYGGLEAYGALQRDFANTDTDLGEMLKWAGVPRLQLAKSRELAARFLRNVAPELPPAAQSSANEAATLYEEVAGLLRREWPLPDIAALEGADAMAVAGEATLRRPHAGAVIEAAKWRESRAAALLEQAVADALRAR